MSVLTLLKIAASDTGGGAVLTKEQCKQLTDDLEQVKRERDEAVAHVSKLEGVLKSMGDSHMEDGEVEAAEMLYMHIGKNASQCLREIQAEAVLTYNQHLRADLDNKLPIRCIGVHGYQYAAKVRQGGE